ncbi:MAG: right-handed parallel beta-helix repeat-containing protein, partial [Candidatus Hodarchaeales archaeon]
MLGRVLRGKGIIRQLLFTALTLFIALSFFDPVQASLEGDSNLFWVRPDGNDSCSGKKNLNFVESSIDCAWSSIQKASDTIKPGDIVNILPGTYNEQVVLKNSGLPERPITFRGVDIPVLNGGNKTSGRCIDVNNQSHITIEGLHITRCNEGVRIRNDDVTNIKLRQFKITDTGTYGIDIVETKITDSSFTDFEMSNNDLASIRLYDSKYRGTRGILISKFLIKDNQGSGILARYVKNLNIEDGSIYNVLNGIQFHMAVNDSLIKNNYINNSRWHGVAIISQVDKPGSYNNRI